MIGILTNKRDILLLILLFLIFIVKHIEQSLNFSDNDANKALREFQEVISFSFLDILRGTSGFVQ